MNLMKRNASLAHAHRSFQCIYLLSASTHSEMWHWQSIRASCLGSFTINGARQRPGANIQSKQFALKLIRTGAHANGITWRSDWLDKWNNGGIMLDFFVSHHLRMKHWAIVHIFVDLCSNPAWLSANFIHYEQNQVPLPWQSFRSVRVTHL